MLKTSKFAKLYPHQTFPLYGILYLHATDLATHYIYDQVSFTVGV